MAIKKCFWLLTFIVVFLAITINCSTFGLENIKKSKKIALKPLINLTGFDLSNFPLLIYKDSELSKLFSVVPLETINLADALENELEKAVSNKHNNIIAASEIKKALPKNIDYAKQRQFLVEHFECELSINIVLTRINISGIFSTKKIIFYAGLLLVSNQSGKLVQKTEREFVFDLPASIYSPLGADLSNYVYYIIQEIILKLLK